MGAFPDLAEEQTRLSFARACRDAMIARLESVDPQSAADDITAEYVEMTVWEALDTLRSPGAGDFFGRIDELSPDGPETDRWYIGRRHIEDDEHDPVVVDWRAPISAPFYRATAVDPLGLTFRRRFTLTDGELTAYLDEDLADPDGGAAATGIPDPVLAEIGAERSGAMREIVATIQAEQDIVIRAPIDVPLIVQGGPGTGKTAVALHRAAYLLFEHRRRLSTDGVLVVGPNRAFLDYIANVLPSLGERSVRQCTALDLCIPRVELDTDEGDAIDDVEAARWKGSAERLADLEALALDAIQPGDDDIRVPIGARTHVFSADEFAGWVATAKTGVVPINERRERLRVLAREALRRRCNGDDMWSSAGPLKAAVNAAWSTQKPIKLVDSLLTANGYGPGGRKRRWTAADQYLVDEANTLLNGTPFTYGHVVVDEAQDHSAVALRVIGRRAIKGSLTLVGDVAQSTTPAGQQRWADVFAFLGVDAGTVADLTIGYRVPEPILVEANKLLPLTGVDATASRSVRVDGDPPTWHLASADDLARKVAEVVATVKHRHRLTGLVAAETHHAAVTDALAALGFVAVDHVHELADEAVPLFTPEAVKGLEFDGVVVVEPDQINDGTSRGARLLYVAMTRAVQELAFVATSP